MSKLHKTVRKAVPKEIRKLDPIGWKVDKEVAGAWDSLTPKMPKQEPVAPERVIPLPDEEELARIRRRRITGGGRSSSILTNDEQFGP